jgi:hypothetical protein
MAWPSPPTVWPITPVTGHYLCDYLPLSIQSPHAHRGGRQRGRGGPGDGATGSGLGGRRMCWRGSSMAEPRPPAHPQSCLSVCLSVRPPAHPQGSVGLSSGVLAQSVVWRLNGLCSQERVFACRLLPNSTGSGVLLYITLQRSALLTLKYASPPPNKRRTLSILFFIE